jgi:hypothetical protein
MKSIESHQSAMCLNHVVQINPNVLSFHKTTGDLKLKKNPYMRRRVALVGA